MDLPLDLLALDKAPASDIKAKGWPGLMRRVRANGAVVVTNHNHPEAVIVEAEQYRRLVAEASSGSASQARAQSLASLQASFDARLASLKEDALAKALERPARRGGKVALGTSR